MTMNTGHGAKPSEEELDLVQAPGQEEQEQGREQGVRWATGAENLEIHEEATKDTGVNAGTHEQIETSDETTPPYRDNTAA